MIIWKKLYGPLAIEVWETDIAGFKLRALADGRWVISGWHDRVVETGALSNDLETAKREVIEHARALFEKALAALIEPGS